MSNWFMALIRMLFGTPQRFAATAVGGVILYAACNPGWLVGKTHQLGSDVLNAVNPLIGPLFQLAVIVAAMVWIVRAPFRKGGKK